MGKKCITDEQVEQEISRLLNSDAVKLAKAVERERNKRRQYMYCLRTLEKSGLEMLAKGITLENFEKFEV